MCPLICYIFPVRGPQGSCLQWLHDGPSVIVSGEAILSAENSGKPLGSWGSAPNPTGELTALPRPSSWLGASCPLTNNPSSRPLSTFGISLNGKCWAHPCHTWNVAPLSHVECRDSWNVTRTDTVEPLMLVFRSLSYFDVLNFGVFTGRTNRLLLCC